MRAGRHWHRLPRWLRRTLAGLGVLFVFVPVVTNAVLWLRIVPRLMNADSAAFQYRFAWAPWPTHVKVYSLRIVGEDPNVQFAVAVKEAWLTLELWPLIGSRTIRIARMRGSGVSVRALQRLNPWDVTARKVNALPDIPGHPKPPLRFAYVPPPPVTPQHYDRFSVDVRDIDAAADEVWIDEFRYRGNLHVTGAFLLRPGLALHIGPDAAVDIRGGELSVAGRVMLAGLYGRATCRTPHFDPVKPEGRAILRFFSGSLRLDGELPNADFARYFLTPRGGEVRGGSGHASVRVAFRHGKVGAGSALDVTSRDLELAVAKTRVHAALSIHGAVDGSGRGALDVTAEHLALGPRAPKSRSAGGVLRAHVVTVGPADLADPHPTLSYVASLRALSADVTAIVPYLPESTPVTLDAGHVTVTARVSGTQGKSDLRATAHVRGDVAAHAKERRFSGKVALDGNVAEDRDRFELTGSKLGLSDLTVAKGKQVTYGWWTHAEVTQGGVIKARHPKLELDLSGGLRDIDPLFTAFGEELGVPGWLQDLVPLPDTAWRGHLADRTRSLSISHFRATSGAVVVELKLTKTRGQEPKGAVKITSGPLSFGVAFASDQTTTQPFATDDWFEQQP